MSLKFDFPADADKVFALLTDPDFLVERNIAIGDLDTECEVEQEGLATKVKMTRTRDIELPSFLTDLFGDHPVLTIEEGWRPVKDHYEGSYITTIEGQAGTVNAEFSLLPSKKGCTFKITHSAKIKIPLIARKIEKFIVSVVSKDIEKEINYLSSVLES